MTCAGVLVRIDRAAGAYAAHGEAGVGGAPVVLEVEAVFDEQSAKVGVVANAIAADPRVHERKCQDERDDQHASSAAQGDAAATRRCRTGLVIPRRSACDWQLV